jgi:hypothetical protein
MSYEVEPINSTAKEKVVDPRSNKSKVTPTAYKWWMAQNDNDLRAQLLSTVEYLKRTNQQRIRQASIYTRLYSGKPLYNYLASNAALDNSNSLPIGRPTANVVYSCTDTLVSRISQDKPRPTFLTNGGNYRMRKLAEASNQFLDGEFFRLKAYQHGPFMLRNACVLGDGLIKVFSKNKKVCFEQTLPTELLTDFNDAYYGAPRQLIQLKLIDRSVIENANPKKAEMIANAAHGNVDGTPRSTETISDQIIVAEAWHLRSGPDADDGRHTIVCSDGVIADDSYDKDGFPFVKLGYNPGIVGFLSQGLAEILMPTQMEIYRNLILASQSLELMGVPRILIEELSNVLDTDFNNRIGTIVRYRGTKPEVINAQSNNPELYQWIQWLIQNAYQMSGISSMSAGGTVRPGLNSGESIREYDAIQEDRFAALARRYQESFSDLGTATLAVAKEIYDEYGEYSSEYVGKDGIKRIDFKEIARLKDNYVIQCYEESALPKDPAGRQAKLSEMLAAGEITPQEFRRLSSFPDLKQSDMLANALEERILKCLDEVVDHGEKALAENGPDPFMLDPTNLADKLVVNYINLYATLELEPEKIDALHTWFAQLQDVKKQVAPPPMPQQMPGQGQGSQQLSVVPPQASVSPTSNAAV